MFGREVSYSCKMPNDYEVSDVYCLLQYSESALFAKCAQTHKEFVVVFKKLLVHSCIHTYISDMRTEHLNKT